MRQKIILGALVAISFLAFQSQALGQKKNKTVENGFWQIVSNVQQPRLMTIQFYTNERQLIYEEILTNVRLKISKKSVRRKLDGTLREAYEFWIVNQARPAANDLLAKRL